MTTVAEPAPGRSRRVRAVCGFAAGAVLLGLAIWAAVSQPGALGAGWDAAARAPGWMIALAVFLPIVNWALTSTAFFVLTRRFGRVGFGEMLSLIGAAGLLNYLPLRPGLAGRVAYHKVVNRIAVTDSMKVLVLSLGCSAAAIGFGVGAAFGMAAAGPGAGGVGIAAAPWLVFLVAGAALVQRGRQRDAAIVLALIAKYADLLVWSLRYWAVFGIVGEPIGMSSAIALAAVAQVATLIPLAGNGLGLREWAVGLTVSLLPAGIGTPVGLTADLLNRAAELATAVPIGLLCVAWVAVRVRMRRLPEQGLGGRGVRRGNS